MARNGPASRVLAVPQGALRIVRNAGSSALRTGNSVWRSVANGANGLVGKTGKTLNNTGRRLLTGKRGGRRMAGGRRTTKKNRKGSKKTRKSRK